MLPAARCETSAICYLLSVIYALSHLSSALVVDLFVLPFPINPPAGSPSPSGPPGRMDRGPRGRAPALQNPPNHPHSPKEVRPLHYHQPDVRSLCWRHSLALGSKFTFLYTNNPRAALPLQGTEGRACALQNPPNQLIHLEKPDRFAASSQMKDICYLSSMLCHT